MCAHRAEEIPGFAHDPAEKKPQKQIRTNARKTTKKSKKKKHKNTPQNREEIPTFLAHLSYARQMIIFFARKRESSFFFFFFARKREIIWCFFGVFFGVFVFCVLGGCFCAFCFFFVFRALARNFLGLFFAVSQAKPGISSVPQNTKKDGERRGELWGSSHRVWGSRVPHKGQLAAPQALH